MRNLLGLMAVVAAAVCLLPVNAQTPAANPAAEAPLQPVPFSHKLHAGMQQISCESCHTMSRSGENLSIPQAGFCMQCHQAIATNNPDVQKLAEYASSGELIPWVRVYQLPSFVSFSHRTHISNGVTCRQCHGQVQERVAMYHDVDWNMARCMACHQASKAATGCDACHALQK